MSCNSATHHLYDTLRPEAQPLASFSGHVNGSFYIRACFSPDGSHILSGSSDHRAYIWAVRSLLLGSTPFTGLHACSLAVVKHSE